jgi:hypothetical protein
LSGSNKTKISKFIERDFGLHFINIEKYIKTDNLITKKISDDITIYDYDNIDSFDWDEINKEIEKYKSTGIVICGPYFPQNKIKSDVNFHIQIKIQKQILIEKRLDYVKHHPEKFKKISEIANIELITKIINSITYPYFIEYSQQSKIDKYINSKDLNIDQIYDEVANYLFYKIKKDLDQYNEDKLTNTVVTKTTSNENYGYGENFHSYDNYN